MRRLWIFVGVPAVLGAGALCYWLGAARSPEGQSLLKAQRGPFPITVVETGELLAVDQRTIMTRGGGQIEYLIPEGTRVEKGAVVAVLEHERFDNNLKNDEMDLETATKRLEELRENIKIAEARAELDKGEAEDRLDIAKLKGRELRSRPDEMERSQAKIDFAAAEADLESAQREMTRVKALAEAEVLSVARLQDATLARELAQANFKAAKLRYDAILAGATELERESAKLDVAEAENSFKMAVAAADSTLRGLAQDIAGAENQVQKVEGWKRNNLKAIEDRQLKAPADGMVVYRMVQMRDTASKIEVGSRVWDRMGILELPDMSRLKVRTKISESASGCIRIGSQAVVTVDTIPGEEFQGEVIWIDRWAHDRNQDLDAADQAKEGRSEVMVFYVEVLMKTAGLDERLKLGFKAKVRFQLRQLEDAVFIPAKVVRSEEGSQFVLVKRRLGAEKVRVTLGPVNDTDVVVEKGLEGGELVVE